MKQRRQKKKKSLALELNKYLSHWKALGLFSKYVQQNAGWWGCRASGCRLLVLLGFEVLQEPFGRARVSFFIFGGKLEMCTYCSSGSIRCLCDCFQRSTSDMEDGYTERVLCLLQLCLSGPFLLLKSRWFPPFPFAKVIQARCTCFSCPGCCPVIPGERGWTNPTFLEEEPL